MFICKNCKSIDKFELMFSPEYKGNKKFQHKYNSKNEIEIVVDGYTFIPDLTFMNQFAVCRYCGQIYMWEYEDGYLNKNIIGDRDEQKKQ